MDKQLGSGYLLHDPIGRGAMGEVYAGTARESGTPVAVKVLKPELVSDPEVVARFLRERSVLTSITHPNVVHVIDLVAEGGTLAIVMELIRGQDLRHMLRQRHTLPPAEAVRLIRQVLDGVAAVHAAGIIHRDVKPENLLVDTFRELPWLKLTDFGVARLSYGASLTNLTSVIGTPEYMAPELAEHESATPAADLYSAGIVLYEMLCGRTPFAGGHPLAVLRRHADQPPPPIPGIPSALQDYLGLLLAKDPRSRPKAATEAAAALAPLESSLASLPAPPPMQAPGHGVTPASAIPGGSVSPQRPVADLAGSATVLRHRDRGHAADENSNGQHHSPGGRPGGPLASAPKRGAWRSRPMALAALAAAVIVVAATAATMLVPHSHQAPPRSMAATSYYVFSPQQYRNGLLISRRWALGGTNGSLLTETVTASSTTGKPIRVPFQETIPAAVAPNLRTVHFTPTPNKIIRADPVVEWQLSVPPHGSITVGYQAAVPPRGVTYARLANWAQAFQTLQTQLPARGAPAPTSTPPTRASTVQPSAVPLPPAPTSPSVVPVSPTTPHNSTSQDGNPCFSRAIPGVLVLPDGEAVNIGGPMYESAYCSSIHIKLTSALYRTYARSCLETPDGQTITNCSNWILLSYPNTYDTLSTGVPVDTRWVLEMYSTGPETARYYFAY